MDALGEYEQLRDDNGLQEVVLENGIELEKVLCKFNVRVFVVLQLPELSYFRLVGTGDEWRQPCDHTGANGSRMAAHAIQYEVFQGKECCQVSAWQFLPSLRGKVVGCDDLVHLLRGEAG